MLDKQRLATQNKHDENNDDDVERREYASRLRYLTLFSCLLNPK